MSPVLYDLWGLVAPMLGIKKSQPLSLFFEPLKGPKTHIFYFHFARLPPRSGKESGDQTSMSGVYRYITNSWVSINS